MKKPPIKPYSPKEILEGLRELYAEWRKLKIHTEHLSDIRLPDYEAMLDQIEKHVALQAFQDHVAAWQSRTFPHQLLEGKLAHLEREVGELRKDPSDADEWADTFILLLGSAAKCGYSVADLLWFAEQKFAICQSRRWGQADSEGVHHHL